MAAGAMLGAFLIKLAVALEGESIAVPLLDIVQDGFLGARIHVPLHEPHELLWYPLILQKFRVCPYHPCTFLDEALNPARKKRNSSKMNIV